MEKFAYGGREGGEGERDGWMDGWMGDMSDVMGVLGGKGGGGDFDWRDGMEKEVSGLIDAMRSEATRARYVVVPLPHPRAPLCFMAGVELTGGGGVQRSTRAGREDCSLHRAPCPGFPRFLGGA